jgi:electron transfer flavoprotein alpha/beta subunit
MLNIVVCVKAVPDPNDINKLKIDPVTKSLPRMAIPLVINPLDSHAVEAALETKRKYGAHITVLSMGPPPAGSILKECLALGVDKAILLSDRAFAGADAFATAFTLAKAIEKSGSVDIIFCGVSSSDGATEWVGPEIAAILKLPVVTMVREIVEDQGDEWILKADYERGYRLVQVGLPAVFTVTRNLNHPKALSFSGILKARSKEITVWDRETLDVPEDRVGLKGSPTIVTRMEHSESKRKVEIFEGSAEEKAERLVQILSDAGVI